MIPLCRVRGRISKLACHILRSSHPLEPNLSGSRGGSSSKTVDQLKAEHHVCSCPGSDKNSRPIINSLRRSSSYTSTCLPGKTISSVFVPKQSFNLRKRPLLISSRVNETRNVWLREILCGQRHDLRLSIIRRGRRPRRKVYYGTINGDRPCQCVRTYLCAPQSQSRFVILVTSHRVPRRGWRTTRRDRTRRAKFTNGCDRSSS